MQAHSLCGPQGTPLAACGMRGTAPCRTFSLFRQVARVAELNLRTHPCARLEDLARDLLSRRVQALGRLLRCGLHRLLRQTLRCQHRLQIRAAIRILRSDEGHKKQLLRNIQPNA